MEEQIAFEGLTGHGISHIHFITHAAETKDKPALKRMPRGHAMDPDSRPGDARIQIMEDGRTLQHISLGNLILQTELRVATKRNIQAFPCPCVNCHGALRKAINVIREHHTLVGRDPFLTKSIIGGDPAGGYPASGIWVEDMAFDDDIVDANTNIQGNVDVNENVGDVQGDGPRYNTDMPLDQYHDVHRQVMEALD